MAKIMVTKTALERAKADAVIWGKDQWLWDTELEGFGMRVSTNSGKAFACLQYWTGGAWKGGSSTGGKSPSGNMLNHWNHLWFHSAGMICRSRQMWTQENRGRYDRSKLRYPSDLTEEEWALIAPLIPPAKPGGNKRTVKEREVINGVMYILSTGCQWAALPKDLPPRSTVNDYFLRWDYDGTLDRIHHALYVQCRDEAGRDTSPTAAIIDSQSVKGAEKGGARSTRPVTTQASRRNAERCRLRSRARSGMSWSTRKAC